MLRRDLLRSLAALPMLRHYTRDAVSVPLSEKHIVVFFDSRSVNLESLQSIPLHNDGMTYTFVPLKINHGQNIENAIRLYEVTDGK